MTSVGDTDAGFSLAFDEATRWLDIRVWGFWSPDVALQFAPAVMDACHEAKSITHLVIDARELKPQRDEAQAAIGAMFAALPDLSVARTTVVSTNALTRLQLTRLANSSPAKGLVTFAASHPGGEQVSNLRSTR